jgi:hypothetical protein
MPEDRLKICTFNAKTDKFDHDCCMRDAICESGCMGKKIPDSLVANMISVAILPDKPDIINIQNVKNDMVAKHLVKEICRVKSITDKFCSMSVGQIDFANSAQFKYEVSEAICELNSFTGLCDDGLRFRDALAKCTKLKLDYIRVECDKCTSEPIFDNSHARELFRYVGVSEYDAFYNCGCLTLIRKDLQINPTIKNIPCVDSLVLFFIYGDRKLINVNVNLGGFSYSTPAVKCKQQLVNRVICFLKEYEDCGALIMSGAMGDLDYDIPQLLYRGDSLTPEMAQQLTSYGIGSNPTPSDFPEDICHPLYKFMEYLLECNAEHIPYSWLLQYLRIKMCESCGLSLFSCKCSDEYDGPECFSSCSTECSETDSCSSELSCTNNIPCSTGRAVDVCCKKSLHVSDAMKSPLEMCNAWNGKNRAHLREIIKKCDKKRDCRETKTGTISDEHRGPFGRKCDRPSCVPEKCKPCDPVCKTVCKDKCKIKYNPPCKPAEKCVFKCEEERKCEPRNCYKVDVDPCKDLCKKACCDSCAKTGGNCGGKNKCKENPCEVPEKKSMCDTLSSLKRDLCVVNILDKIQCVDDRFTGFFDHFNPCLDCKFPRGIFQSWVQCKDYDLPKTNTRIIDNNSELLALDHILVSSCLKNYVVCAKLSDPCIELCSETSTFNKYPFYTGPHANCNNQFNKPPDYSKARMRSFFTHRVYCADIDLPPVNKQCEVVCSETLNGLGLSALWCLLDKWDCGIISISTLEYFYLDKHPFFIDFFYNTIHNNFARETNLVGKGEMFNDLFIDTNGLLLNIFKNRTCSTSIDRLALIQKKSTITRQEFYDHLSCVFTQTDNRDRFILIIGLMGALVKCLAKDPCLLKEEQIRLMFFLVSECYNNRVELTNMLQTFIRIVIGTCNPIYLENKDFISVLESVGETISALSECISEDCLLRNLLLKYAIKGLDCDGDCRFNKNDVFLLSEKIDQIIDMIQPYLKCNVCTEDVRELIFRVFDGESGKDVLVNLVEKFVCRDKIVQFLLALGTSQNCVESVNMLP